MPVSLVAALLSLFLTAAAEAGVLPPGFQESVASPA